MKNSIKKGWHIAILFFTLIFIFQNCKSKTSPPSKDLSSLDWLIGTWEVNKGTYYERWIKLNDNSFFGRSFQIYSQTDTVMMETIELVKKENDILYIPTVKTQNGNKPVVFKLTSNVENSFVFENPAHDFPKKISYFKVDKSTAKVQIGDEERKVDYDFKKME